MVGGMGRQEGFDMGGTDTDTAAGAFRDAVARVAPHGTFHGPDGEAVGCWWLSRISRPSPFARGPGAGRDRRTVTVKGLRRTGDGRLAAAAVTVTPGEDAGAAVATALDAAGDPAPGLMLGDCLLEMAAVAGTYPAAFDLPPPAATHHHDEDDVAAAAGALAPRPPDARAIAKHGLLAVRGRIQGFLAGLGSEVPHMLHAATRATRRHDHAPVAAALGATWHLVDPRCDPEAPLRNALVDQPLLAGFLVDEAMRAPDDFRRDALAGNLDAVVARHPGVRDALPHTLALALPALAAAKVRAMRRDGYPPHSPSFDLSGDATGADMHLLRAMAPLAALPRNWVPRSPAAWDAYVSALPTLAEVHVPREALAAHLAVGGDWEAFASRLSRVAGGTRPDLAARDARDMYHAFSRQVTLPALLACQPVPEYDDDTALVASLLAESILAYGRTLATTLDMSREWHRRRTAMAAAVTSCPGRKVTTGPWDAWMPDHAAGDLRLRVLASEGALMAEGEAMWHCVGGYGHDCARGSCRIASVTRAMPDGAERRVATADFRFVLREGAWLPRLHELRGHGNEEPEPGCTAFVVGYVAAFESGELRVAGDPVPDDVVGDEWEPFPDRIDEVGYDWVHAGNRKRVLAAWHPVLPKALRAATVADIDAVVTGMGMGLDGLGLTAWRPEPVAVAGRATAGNPATHPRMSP